MFPLEIADARHRLASDRLADHITRRRFKQMRSGPPVIMAEPRNPGCEGSVADFQKLKAIAAFGDMGFAPRFYPPAALTGAQL